MARVTDDERQPLQGSDFLDQVCKALGIDSTYVHKLTITAEVGELVRVDVERFGSVELLRIEALQAKDD